jgi:DNA invertase Pin-like site-specific DNA recombinase
MVSYVTYRRVSTREQSKSGLGLEAQSRDIRLYLDNYSPEPWEVIGEFVETKSGSEDDRPELTKAIDLAKRKKAILLVAKLDRLSRDVEFIAKIIKDKRLSFRVASMPTADKFQLHIYAALAEQERDFISTRTRDALAEAKIKGVKLGNPRKRTRTVNGEKRIGWEPALKNGRAIITAEADQFAANVTPIIDGIRSSGIDTLQGIADALNNRGIKTRRDGRWYAKTVANILNREAA